MFLTEQQRGFLFGAVACAALLAAMTLLGFRSGSPSISSDNYSTWVVMPDGTLYRCFGGDFADKAKYPKSSIFSRDMRTGADCAPVAKL